MLALSPQFTPTYGWPLEDLNIQNLQQKWNNIPIEVEANSYDHSLVDFPTYDEIQHDFSPENSNSDDPVLVVKKLHHNASERHRRKRVNDLYGSLRSLLPISNDQNKKVSIPGVVSRAVKYIPELQNEVDTLLRKKEKISSYSSSKATLKKQDVGIKNQNAKEATLKKKSSVVSSVRVLGEKEVVIQLISSTDDMSKTMDMHLLSMVLEFLEQEEEAFVLLNATTFKCSGEGMLLNTLHLQKKVSIPGVVSRAVKYIPELQNEVDTLIRKKEKISSYSSSKAELKEQDIGIKNQNGKEATLETKSSVVTSVRVLGEKEVIIQLISSTDNIRKTKDIGLLSMVLEFLEQEEDGFILLNATTFKCSGEGMLLNNLLLQVQGDNVMDAEKLMEKLHSFNQQSDRLLF